MAQQSLGTKLYRSALLLGIPVVVGSGLINLAMWWEETHRESRLQRWSEEMEALQQDRKHGLFFESKQRRLEVALARRRAMRDPRQAHNSVHGDAGDAAEDGEGSPKSERP